MKIFLIILAAFLVLQVIISVVATFITFNIVFLRRDEKGQKKDPASNAYLKRYEKELKDSIRFLLAKKAEKVHITSKDGLKLAADFYDAGSDRTALFFHGYTSLPMANFAIIGRKFYERGYNILLITHRAHGESEGEYCTLGLLEQEDVISWTEWCRDRGLGQLVLYGISMGCASVSYASDRLDKELVRALILDCGFSSPYEQISNDGRKMHVPYQLIMPILTQLARKRLGINLKQKVSDSLSKCKIPALFIHGVCDSTVDIKYGIENYESCSSEKKMIKVEGAEHTMAFLDGGDKVCEEVFNFIA